MLRASIDLDIKHAISICILTRFDCEFDGPCYNVGVSEGVSRFGIDLVIRDSHSMGPCIIEVMCGCALIPEHLLNRHSLSGNCQNASSRNPRNFVLHGI